MPPLVEVRAYSLLIVPVRFVLALAGFAGARLLGVSPGGALTLWGLGAGLFVLAMLTSRRRRLFWLRAHEATPIDSEAPVAGRAQTVARAASPSTIAVSALTAIALPLNPSLAALLAGVLAGMAVVGLVFGVELVLWEREAGVRLLATTGLRSELYVRPGAS